MSLDVLVKSEGDADKSPLNKYQINYVQMRAARSAYSEVLRVFDEAERSGMTRASIARRIIKKPEQITRWLSKPGNWTIKTLSLLLAAVGYRLEVRAVPASGPKQALLAERSVLQTDTSADNSKICLLIDPLVIFTEELSVRAWGVRHSVDHVIPAGDFVELKRSAKNAIMIKNYTRYNYSNSFEVLDDKTTSATLLLPQGMKSMSNRELSNG